MATSETLLQANQRLLQLRAEQGIETIPFDVSASRSLSENGIETIPPVVLESQSLLERAKDFLNGVVDPVSTEPEISKPEISKIVRVSPTLMNAIRSADSDVMGRIWLLLRHLDQEGQGWIAVDRIRKKLTVKKSVFYVCGQRRLRDILRDGEGIFWERDGQGRLWIYGMVRMCLKFDIERLSGDNIEVGIEDVTESLKKYRATMYGAFLAGKKSQPISRETIAELSGINERTQREYDDVIGIKKTKNFSIDTRQNETNREEYVWEHQRASFTFRDGKGKQGEKGATYNARRLPNSYKTQFQKGTDGRKRKINQQLRMNLVDIREQGNDSNTVGRLFHTNGRTIRTAIKKGRTAILRHYERRDFAMWSTYEGGTI